MEMADQDEIQLASFELKGHMTDKPINAVEIFYNCKNWPEEYSVRYLVNRHLGFRTFGTEKEAKDFFLKMVEKAIDKVV